MNGPGVFSYVGYLGGGTYGLATAQSVGAGMLSATPQLANFAGSWSATALSHIGVGGITKAVIVGGACTAGGATAVVAAGIAAVGIFALYTNGGLASGMILDEGIKRLFD